MNALRLLPAVAVLCGAAWGAAPSYVANGIVNATNLAPGPFAPNTVLSLFGADLAWSPQAATAEDIRFGLLPTALNGVQVFVSDWPAPLFLVSESQINFLMPPNQIAGKVTVRVARQGVSGPEVQLILKDVAPACIPLTSAEGYVVAQRWPDYSLDAPETPSDAGGIVILYATGLGRTQPYPGRPDEIPQYAGVIERQSDFRVYLNGNPLDKSQVLYAGLAPGWAGLYQINIRLPGDTPRDPEIRLEIGEAISAPGLKLAVSGVR
jgi:uncharacterized protein (TIGR03437 family)